mmetsp:Transcript_260/g.423  ORF Transcript_260/g.423 Transcript_260/m.423 type:complete len:308 (-) Transcript_260:29-952(-)
MTKKNAKVRKNRGNNNNADQYQRTNSSNHIETNHNMEDWISNLAKKASNDNHNDNHTNNGLNSCTTTTSTTSSKILSKEERIQNRAAKKRRREERQNVTNTNKKRGGGSSINQQQIQHHAVEEDAEDDNERPPRDPSVELLNQDKSMHAQIIGMEKISTQVQKCIKRLYKGKTFEGQKYAKPFATPIEKGKAKSGHKLSDKLIQPRKNDYGGLGLARPSLLIDLRDVSFVPKLEEEFSEHVPGFFGKQRTKAMKRQLDGNMLWRRLSSAKVNGKYDDTVKNVKVDGKKLSEMTPDERVEAMIKLNMI